LIGAVQNGAVILVGIIAFSACLSGANKPEADDGESISVSASD